MIKLKTRERQILFYIYKKGAQSGLDLVISSIPGNRGKYVEDMERSYVNRRIRQIKPNVDKLVKQHYLVPVSISEFRTSILVEPEYLATEFMITEKAIKFLQQY